MLSFVDTLSSVFNRVLTKILDVFLEKLTSQCNTCGYTGDLEEEENNKLVITNDQAEQDWRDYGGKTISPLSMGRKVLKYKIACNRDAISPQQSPFWIFIQRRQLSMRECGTAFFAGALFIVVVK